MTPRKNQLLPLLDGADSQNDPDWLSHAVSGLNEENSRMKRLQTRAGFKVSTNVSQMRVHLRLGMDIWTLTGGEALELANLLVDRAEALSNCKESA